MGTLRQPPSLSGVIVTQMPELKGSEKASPVLGAENEASVVRRGRTIGEKGLG